MTILTEKFRFIGKTVFLCPWVDTDTGKQKLIMQKINLKTGKVELKKILEISLSENLRTKEIQDY